MAGFNRIEIILDVFVILLYNKVYNLFVYNKVYNLFGKGLLLVIPLPK